MADIPKDQLKNMKEGIEGWEVFETGSSENEPDDITGADTTAFPSRITHEGTVTHDKRTLVGEETSQDR